MRKNRLLIMALSFLTMPCFAQVSPLWLRHCAISPDGNTIAFSYKGDIFTVNVNGGEAKQITTNAEYDAYPVWSKDGSKIAFASTREGSMDVYIMNSIGGEAKRLTFESGTEIPLEFKDDKTLLFEANIMPTAKTSLFASGSFPQVYEVSIDGSRPKLFSTLPMQDLSINSQGDILYHDKKGYEDEFRKHHTSPITRDIWLNKNNKYTKLTSFNGEDRTPVWATDNNNYYYLSEEDGTFNVYKNNLNGSNKQQLTKHTKNPVRFLTVSNNSTICYAYDGEIYTLKEGGSPQKVNISIIADSNDKNLIQSVKTYGATEAVLSPDGKEVAFVLGGDVYVTSVDYNTTKQITNTPEQERSVVFSPDGKAIAYASERNGLWQIYETKKKNAKEDLFTYATELEEKQIVKSDKTSFAPKYSPNGKSIAFWEDRGTLKTVDLKSLKTTEIMDKKHVYSYQDGDIWFEWSPDSKWIMSSYIGTGGWNNVDIALHKADGSGEVHNLTQSGYNDGNAKWALGGKAIIFSSDRAGYRSHGSWGAEEDAYIMFFDLDEYDKFKMSKEDRERLNEQEKQNKEDKKDDKKDKKNKNKKDKAKAEEKAIELDLENNQDRVIRLTSNSSRLGDILVSPTGDSLYYQAAFEGGYDLWRYTFKENKTELVLKNVGFGVMSADKGFKNIFLCTSSGIKKINLSTNKIDNVNFEAQVNDKPYEEREYIFNHVWQQVKDKFYMVDLHGVDWEGYKETYKKFLPHINNKYDFSNMLSEMLGELNASHTGSRYFDRRKIMTTAYLGIFVDYNYDGDGVKIDEIIKQGPFAVKNTGVTKGCVIESIDGEKLVKGTDYTYLLNGKVNKKINVGVYNPQTNKRFNVVVKGISKGAQSELLYKRWVNRNKEIVDSISNGTVAYVHVKAMDSESFREVYSKLLNDENRSKKAVVVDERHNGGGWLHDDLCTLLSGKKYQEFVPRGQYIGSDPFNKWTKPSCVLICEDDYSNGHGFPSVYKTLGIGELVGTPVAGTMTAVWWETQIDPEIVFGIPQVGCRALDGTYGENTQLNPDIEVYNSPEDYINGKDPQLERAVRLMMSK